MDERHDIEGTAATNGTAGGNGSMQPVLAGTEARAIERPAPAAIPAPVVAAAGGAVVGAFAVALLRVLRRPARRRGTVRVGRRWGRRDSIEVAGSRSFLVDVHVLKR
jgi:peptidoglycan/LPS O-acetylase OafA/YrhL